MLFLLAQDIDGREHVCQYELDEANEIFGHENVKAVQGGEVLLHNETRYVDMMHAARAALK